MGESPILKTWKHSSWKYSYCFKQVFYCFCITTSLITANYWKTNKQKPFSFDFMFLLYNFIIHNPGRKLSHSSAVNYYMTFVMFHFPPKKKKKEIQEAAKKAWVSFLSCTQAGKCKEQSLPARALLDMKNSIWKQCLSFLQQRKLPAPQLLPTPLWVSRVQPKASPPAESSSTTPLLPYMSLLSSCVFPSIEVWQPNLFFLGMFISLKPLIFSIQ